MTTPTPTTSQTTAPVPSETTAPAVGDLYCMSWGYDQTNLNFFQVVGLTPSGVKVREIGGSEVPGSQGFMSCQMRPLPHSFLKGSQWCGEENRPMFRRLRGGSFSIKGRYIAFKTSPDREHYCSWYA